MTVAGGLVEQHVGEPLRRDRLAVDLDAVARLDERVQLPRLAVDAHAAGLDQLVGAAPRRDARPWRGRHSGASGVMFAHGQGLVDYGALEDMYRVGEIKRAVEPRFACGAAAPARPASRARGALSPRRRDGRAALRLAGAVADDDPGRHEGDGLLVGARRRRGPRVAGRLGDHQREKRHWADSWQEVSDWADPPPWQ